MTEPKKTIGIWEKKSKNEGKVYYGGQLPDGRYFSIFANEYKREGDNQPIFKMVINEPKVQTVSSQSSESSANDDLPF